MQEWGHQGREVVGGHVDALDCWVEEECSGEIWCEDDGF